MPSFRLAFLGVVDKLNPKLPEGTNPSVFLPARDEPLREGLSFNLLLGGGQQITLYAEMLPLIGLMGVVLFRTLFICSGGEI
jgi:hypothetical protein